MIGIYKIQNKINNKIYIGQSVDIQKRWREHKFSSRHPDDRDHHLPIHLAMAKYGEDNFVYTVLEQCPKEELNEKEIYWIETLSACDKNIGYNIAKGGNDSTHIGRPVEAYDLEGNYITTYPNGAEAARQLNRSYSVIRQVLEGRRLSCANCQLKFADSDKKITKYTNRQGGTKMVQQIDKDTNDLIAIYPSIAEASRITGADGSTITKVCKGKLKSTHGYKWGYME